VSLVHHGKFLRQLGLGYIWTGWVDDVDNELASGKKTVRNEFACAESDGCRVVLRNESSEILGMIVKVHPNHE
jgi:hypothetical protein